MTTDTPADAHPDPYAVLGVAEDASTADINRAYRRLARRAHPDVQAATTAAEHAAATAAMVRLNTARAILTDPTRRAACDRARRRTAAAADADHPDGNARRDATASADAADAAAGRQRPTDATGDGPRRTAQLTAQPTRPTHHGVVPGAIVETPVTVDLGGAAVSPAPAPDVTAADGHPVYAEEFTRPRPHRSRLHVKVDTRKLAADRTYRIPLTVTWGGATTTTALTITTSPATGRRAPRPGPSDAPTARDPHGDPPGWAGRWPFRCYDRRRRLAYWLAGGVGVPLLVMAWAAGWLTEPTGGAMAAPTGMAGPAAGLPAGGLLAGSSWAATLTRGFADPLALPPAAAVSGAASLVVGVVAVRTAKWATIALVVLAAAAVGLGVVAVIGSVVTAGAIVAAAGDA